MKKYKLIKNYPNSRELGFILEPLKVANGYIYFLDNNYIEPQKFPEFWEEIIEKDYKILSIMLQRSIKHEKVLTDNYADRYIKSLINCDGNYIHSVKCLNNDEIFTINDKTNNGTISKFEINGSGVRVFFKEKHDNYHINLNSLIKAKEPLFTTEDGIPVYENDSIYAVDDNFNLSYTDFATKEDSNIRSFSSIETAEQYIIDNKKVLCLDDIKQLSNDKSLINSLEKLIKNRI